MCKCIQAIEKKVKKMKEKDYGSSGVVGTVKILNRALALTGLKPGSWFTYNDIEYEFTPQKKDGTMGKIRNRTVAMHHNFCPWCGKKYEQEKKDKMKPVPAK